MHRAVLHSGEQVVVKVQRPGLQRLFDIDLAQLRTVAAQLDAMEEGRDFTGIYAECEAILRQEIDYITEGRSANRCAKGDAGPHVTAAGTESGVFVALRFCLAGQRRRPCVEAECLLHATHKIRVFSKVQCCLRLECLAWE